MREKIFLMAVFFVLSVLLSSPVTPVAQAGEVIKIGGVGSALGTMKLLASAFAKSHPGTKVVVLPSIGTKGALKAVPDGAIDIGLLGVSLRKEEVAAGTTVTEYARTPFIFVTRKDIEMKGLTTEEVARIYRGDMQRWPGGERIRVILRRPDDADNLILKGLSPGVKKALEVLFSERGHLFAITDQDNLDLIETTPGSLGYTTLAQVIAEKRRVKILSLDRVFPSVKTLADGNYPVSKTLSMMTKQRPSGKVLMFVNFVMSGEGARILKDNGNMVIGNR
jgi:phosphate transport system substrate-binding protein